MNLRKLLNLPSCVHRMVGYQLLIELVWILGLVLLFSLPAALWNW